jgi:diguanylate cyclase (GGDEF)-like protein
MSSEPSASSDPLTTCVLSLAGTSDLTVRLGSVARCAGAIVPDAVVAVLLLDEDAGTLRPAAVHPLSLDAVPAIVVPAGTEEGDAAARAVRDRHEVVVLAGGTVGSAILDAIPSAHAVVHLPMVLDRPGEGPGVEGVLAVACPSSPTENEALATLRAFATLGAFVSLQARFEVALTERSDWFDRLAHTDALTGLANRRTLDRVLDLELARAARQGTALCLAIFGVDGQDAVAERHGAHAADDVLRRVAASLAETVRLVDTVARYGRAEFVVVAPGSAGLAMAQRAAAAIGRIEPGDGEAPIGVSVGVAVFPTDGSSVDELLAASERALAEARTRGTAIVSAT